MTTTFSSALVGLFLLTNASAPSAEWTGPVKDAPPEPTYTTYSVSMTGYNAVPGQTDDTPTVTASGALVNPSIGAARSRDLADELPFGTVVEIVPGTATSSRTCELPSVADGIGYRVITDTMAPRIHNHVDILFPTDDPIFIGGRELNAAKAMGWCTDVAIRVVGHVDMDHMPRNQKELRLAVSEDVSAPLAVNN